MNIVKSFEEYQQQYQQSIENPEAFWADVAGDFIWRKKWDKVLEWDFYKPEVKWFLGGKLNITENCLDRHLPERANQAAIIWEPNDPSEEPRTITYQELFHEVCRVANMLKAQGVQKGDKVCIYMPMIPEVAFAMLACARIGAVHSVVFAGFSSRSLIDRINDAGCKLVLTTDGSYRGDKIINLKAIVDEALESCPSVERVLVKKRTGSKVTMKVDRDVWWEAAITHMPDV